MYIQVCLLLYCACPADLVIVKLEFRYFLLTYVGSTLCILFAFSCIEKDRLQPVSTGFRRFYCISQTVRPATEKIQNQGNCNRTAGCIRLRPVRFRFFFWSMQLDLQTLILSYPILSYLILFYLILFYFILFPFSGLQWTLVHSRSILQWAESQVDSKWTVQSSPL